MTRPHGLQALEQPLASLPETLRQLILERIQNLTHYEPVIGIMGKSGAGKSSLCNELFRGEVSPVSDVNACTRAVLRFRLRSGRHSLVIVDLPGVGENGQRDQEYRALYRRMLPELDLVLWVIKADDRALSVDEHFWRGVMQPYQQQVLFVINQADKIEPCHEWDIRYRKSFCLTATTAHQATRCCRGCFVASVPTAWSAVSRSERYGCHIKAMSLRR